MDVKAILESVGEQKISVAEAYEKLKNLPYEDMGFARLDNHRQMRTGFPEVVFCSGKTPGQTAQIFEKIIKNSGTALGTRASAEHYAAVKAAVPEAEYNEQAGTITALRVVLSKTGLVAVCTGGTADIPVAEEAAVTAGMCGANVERFYDVGVAGLHRLLDGLPRIREARAIVAVAGMEGALAGVVAGLVDVPVIAVPTSIGYGANFGGVSALLTMLNSCAAGVSVVNIDNGFGAGYIAAQINKKSEGC